MFLTIEPMRPLALAISNIVQDITGYPLNEIVFDSILVLLSFVCARSFLMQLMSKPKGMVFQTLFCESFFGQQSRVHIPILTVIAAPVLVWNIWTIVYSYWEIGFAQFSSHPFHLFSSVLTFFQTLFQGKTLMNTQCIL